jgi:hypothetical protein
MRGELRLVLAAQAVRDNDCETAEPSASISTQSFFTSAGLSETVVFNMEVIPRNRRRLMVGKSDTVKASTLW